MSYRDPDFTYRCAGACRQRLDFDEHRPLAVNGLNVCSQCCDMCNFCLEWLDDETCKIYGAAVKTVLPETDAPIHRRPRALHGAMDIGLHGRHTELRCRRLHQAGIGCDLCGYRGGGMKTDKLLANSKFKALQALLAKSKPTQEAK
jgi:hypothetical protein